MPTLNRYIIKDTIQKHLDKQNEMENNNTNDNNNNDKLINFNNNDDTLDDSHSSLINHKKPIRPFFRWLLEEPAGLIILATLLSFYITNAATDLQKIVLRPLISRCYHKVLGKKDNCNSICKVCGGNNYNKENKTEERKWQKDLNLIGLELIFGLIAVYVLYRLLMHIQRKYKQKDKEKVQKAAELIGVILGTNLHKE